MNRVVSFLSLGLLVFLIENCTALRSHNLVMVNGNELIPVNLENEVKRSEYSLLYGWTTWCKPCVNTIKNKLPGLQAAADSAGVNLTLTAICSSESVSDKFRELDNSMKKNNLRSLFCLTEGWSLSDKGSLNQFFSESFSSDYTETNAVPIALLINSKGEIISQDLRLVYSKKFLLASIP